MLQMDNGISKTGSVSTLLTSLAMGLVIYIALDVRAKRLPAKQTMRQAFHLYLSVQAVSLLGKFFKHQLLKATRSVEETQLSFLNTQLKKSAQTEYGIRYDFSSIATVEDFQQRHPLTRYEHYAPYVQRMMAGETNVLTSEQPVIFGVSSGTSGSGSKIVPMLRKQKTLFFFNAVTVLYCVLVQAFPQCKQRLRKSLKIFYNPTGRTSDAGIPIGPNSSTPANSKGVLHMYSTPPAGFELLNEPDALYVHLLFGLKDRHLGMIEGNFASLLYHAMTALRASLADFIDDIQQGTLSAKLNIDPAVRSKLEKLLQPDPERAEEIRRAFEPGVVGVCRRVWPELCVVLTVDSGAFAPYGDKLRQTFLQGVPIYSPVYAATEGLIGINLRAASQPSTYLLHPKVQFFEFIPLADLEQDQPHTLLLHQLEQGQEYEVVLTNVSGLYRYRLGDVVKVVGFENQCPIILFQYRMGQFLNVRGEKTSESVMLASLNEAVAQWEGPSLVDYCCAESILMDDVTDNKSGRPCYHIFLELDRTDVECQQLSDDQKQKIDEALRRQSFVYDSFRQKGSIDAMQVHELLPGAFLELRDYVISNTQASHNQFKVPRVLKRKAFALFLWDKTVQ